MARVFIGIGSNIEREQNIKSGIKVLRERFGSLTISPVYESRAVGFEGDNFLNLVTAFDTELPLEELEKTLHEIEFMFGRDRREPRFSPRTLDLDLLLFDDLVTHEGHLQIPREDITKYAFVLKPLADIAADSVHPVTGQTYSDLWNRFDKQGQELWRVDINFDS
ncbi:MAG: 2-amino-4-hydroxy-6-hydroxymethyldihydropteridine diphosphokinase [Gammaproteobacteria bacterium]